MGKCLITKLNGSVGNTNLPVLGKIRVMFTGTDNNSGASITGHLTLKGSTATWKGEGTCNIGTPIGGLSYNVDPDKNAKGLLLIDSKKDIVYISSSYGYGTNVLLSDINKYCSSLTELYLSNSEQDGDLSEIADLSSLKNLSLSSSKVTGSLANASYLQNLKTLNISKNNKINCSLSDLSSCYALESLNIESSSATGDLSALASCIKLKSLITEGSGITGSISSLANIKSFINYNSYSKPNTWSSSSLRPSSYPKITGNIKFASASDTDNFLINMARCTDEGITDKSWYFQNSHRTSASDAAVSTLQSAGYTLAQLVTD